MFSGSAVNYCTGQVCSVGLTLLHLIFFVFFSHMGQGIGTQVPAMHFWLDSHVAALHDSFWTWLQGVL
jgi:hypothetical protein